MARTIHVYLDDKTEERLLRASSETGRGLSDLAESAVSEAALDYDRSRPRQVRRPPVAEEHPPATPEQIEEAVTRFIMDDGT